VIDDHYGSASYVGGDSDSDGLLDITETWTYQVSNTFGVHNDSEEDPVVNEATATGEDLDGDSVTPGSDTHSTDILHPAIQVVKTGPTYAYWGNSIVFTIVVSNIGDTTLYNVNVYDTIFGDITSYLPDTTLDINEENTIILNYTVPSKIDSINNTVDVSGKDILNLTVTDTDSWIVHTIPQSMVTDSSLCYFDRDEELDGRQFRLIYTQDPKNPGAYNNPVSVHYPWFRTDPGPQQCQFR
jgi:uncharacterized repeat protein (TIGR01451 family)